MTTFLTQRALILSVAAALLAFADAASVSAQTERGGCQFQIYLRPHIEFAGPAGGFDFQLHRPTKDGADIQVSNVYGSNRCSWQATANQDWVTLSQSGGTLEPEGDTVVTVSVNDRATQLNRGVHTAEITFTSRQDPQPNQKKKVKVLLHAQLPCDLQVTRGTYSGRATRGDVPPMLSIAKLSNAGDAPCRWEAHSDRAWLTITPAKGTLRGKSAGQFTIKANTGAAQLVPQDYDATIIVTWIETGPEVLEIEAKLEIDAPPCELYFEPGQSFSATGEAGSEEFDPRHKTFLLYNQGGTACLYWQANSEPQSDWLTVADHATIFPKTYTTFVVQVNQEAAAQKHPGIHPTQINFSTSNQTTQYGIDAELVVETLPCRLEIIETELKFHFEPEGLLQSESEKSITLKNEWTNEACRWKTESARDWLTTEPSSGVVLGNDDATVTVQLHRTEALSELAAGDHEVQLGFIVEEGTADDPVKVTVEIECDPDQPCAYLHATDSAVEVNQPVKISLAVYNPLETNIIANLRLVVPTGWDIQSDTFAERCSSICNKTYSVPPGGNQEFIQLFATPNDMGVFEFRGNVDWKPSTVEVGNETPQGVKTSPLRLEIEVADPQLATDGDTTAQQMDPTNIVAAHAALTATDAPAATTLSRQEPGGVVSTESHLPASAGVTTPDQRAGTWYTGSSAVWIILVIGIVVTFLVIVAWLALRLRRPAPAPPSIDYEALAREIARQQRNSGQGE